MGSRDSLWIAAGMVALALAACSRPPLPVTTNALWRAEEEWPEEEPPGEEPPAGAEVTRDIRLAQAGNAGTWAVGRRTVEGREDRSVVVHVDRYGRFEAKGLAGRNDEEGRHVLSGVFEELGNAVPGPEIFLRIDRDAAWRDVAAVLETARSGRLRWRWYRCHFAVDSPVRRGIAVAEIEARVLPRAATPALRARVAVDRVGEDVVAVRYPGGEERIPAGHPYAPGVVGSANAAWGRLRGALAAARYDRLDVVIADGVPWSHVLAVLAIALDAGTSQVAIDRPEVVLLLSTPPPTPVNPSGSRDSRDWPVWLAVGIGVAAALLVFGRQLRDPRASGLRAVRERAAR